ncbi:MAG: hypothetical protein M1825_002120 [Sarcosagium campestre]|nr:MAG: hypothetical protein M1825_002120 [Sarcosagium campestre]
MTINLDSVRIATEKLQNVLKIALATKPVPNIEPPLTPSDLGTSLHQFDPPSPLGSNATSAPSDESRKLAHYAVIETAVRDKFNELLASASASEKDIASSQIWDLLDVVSILSDNGAHLSEEQCDPGLIFWLIEDLLDGQTIHGCAQVFDYLESRRERITAVRITLSYAFLFTDIPIPAENTVFCGRVFIFLFQSFPLGDKSSVNLRGEFHIENTTAFDSIERKADVEMKDPSPPEVQTQVADEGSTGANGQLRQGDGISAAAESRDAPEQAETHDGKATSDVSIPDTDTLYRIFWSLQETFSNPTRLFDPENFLAFRVGLGATMGTFLETQKTTRARGSSRVSEETRRGNKRKYGEVNDEGTTTVGEDGLVVGFNPKYLTSRDLFELEISDLAFRRHILVQALILIDFLLSLTAKTKAKFAGHNLPNRSVLYQYTLSEEDAKWAQQIRSTIANYLQDGLEGKFYYRMVDTVLSRDKNWVSWKAEGCPLIERPPYSSSKLHEATEGAKRACEPRRIRSTPLGSLDLNFLSDGQSLNGLEKLRRPERYAIPEVKSFERAIANDDFDLEMSTNEDEKQLLVHAKASKTWRTLRLTSRNRLSLFDKTDENGQNLDVIFKAGEQIEDQTEQARKSQNSESLVGEQDNDDVATTSSSRVRDDPAQMVAHHEDTGIGTRAAS